jgi:uncharacterized protein DUF5916/cellulose/xylan binding protein with CBM9 domain
MLIPMALLAAQAGSARQGAAPPVAPTAATTAAYAASAPVIDGRDDDAVWRSASLITAFWESVPIVTATPRFRTTGRIAYDARNLYVFLRADDPHPDSIVTMLARRDAMTASDYLGVLVDSYHDRRSGFEFDVNPSGAKADFAFRDDGEEFDEAWDGVWDVATRVDSLGWTAEFRIPLSQLRYRTAANHTFGIYLWRAVKRTGEGMSWPLRRRSLPGLASQFGDLTGLDSLAPPRRGEFVPYVVAKNVTVPAGPRFGRDEQLALGADLKYALASNLTVNATVNPDFGQVDADPAELNLTAFETFFPERRPFFVEGAGLFSVNLNCGQYSCFHEGLFYSRRIGRSPELRSSYGDASTPAATRILGAAKLTGRLGDLAFGALGSATERVEGPTGLAVEPAARYGVFRASQDLRNGESGVGIIVTAMDRDLDAATAPYLHRSAYAAGVDVRHRFLKEYVIHGSAHWSTIAGSPSAITATQRQPIHNYQRPDDALPLDTPRTRLTGDDEQLAFDKLGGLVRFEAIYTRRSPGFDVNDLGYLRLADQQTAYGWLGVVLETPTRLYRRLVWNWNSWLWATTTGLVTDRAVNTNAHLTLHNLWTLGAWVSVDGLGATFCDRCARGGPAVRQDPSMSTWFDVTGDDRLVPELTVTTASADGGRSSALTVSPSLTLNASVRLSAALAANVSTGHTDAQWVGNPMDSSGQTHYTFAHLDQRTVSITARANYTVSTTLSLQAYLQPFASWGTYRDVRELAAARAAAYADRFKRYDTASNPGGVNAKQLNANVVLRWEYHPGSTLFVVWTQVRQDASSQPGAGGALDNLRGIFDLRADNTLLIKLSHWFN